MAVGTFVATLLYWLGGALLLVAAYFCAWLQYHHDVFVYKTKCKDKKWAKPDDYSTIIANLQPIATKKLYFIRHGESTWNVTFNRDKVTFIFRLIYSCVYDAYLTLTQSDSWFIDSPLCATGVEQADSARQYIKAKHTTSDHAKFLHDGRAILVCSNLRRCLSTAIVALYDRLKRSEEKLVILPWLQEITNNPDSVSITPAFTLPRPSWFDRNAPIMKPFDMNKSYATMLDPTENFGNKPVKGNGKQRIDAFNEVPALYCIRLILWLFSDAVDTDTVVLCGHSLWFMSYFKEFLPLDSNHPSKKKKMKNGAIVYLQVSLYETQQGKVRLDLSGLFPQTIHIIATQ
ncbi:uncharacterized protein MONBRDRAFT_32599 [Monosiga brevicollis MX1]|uniref:Uncharacterized protein n=1 Tax=Monosiga brevicollis TaxID=81824 RepID=A9V0K7_MONBE|nr:uncharacterized protein MONBRDRAFT_32599 [Monosiga brevicollis MX1]EDQ89033.1 predicted protein [Monosiga brevicollis MX1]|eukprot:XP_001746138.1 hypothetical protein [Monosiga brevicollis MX1]